MSVDSNVPPPLIRPRQFEESCPAVPDGASEWETQELKRHWGNALDALERVVVTAAAEHATLRAFDGRRFEHRVQGGGVTYSAATAEAAMVAFGVCLDGIYHRLACAETAGA